MSKILGGPPYWKTQMDKGRPQYEHSSVMKVIYQFPEIVKAYLKTIDVHVSDVKVNEQMGYMHSTKGMVFYFECRTEEKDFAYFKDFSREIQRDHFPKIDYDMVIGPIDGSCINDFTCFVNETIITFTFETPIESLKDIDNFMHMLKTKTQPIAYRKFSEKMDEEITQELGE